MLLATRLACLPDGPWEQDEAIFAGAVFDFDLAAHRPHPPGFPGWVGLARVLHPLTGDAIVSMQLLASVASVAGLVVLAGILATMVSGPVALAVTVLTAFLPGVWFHAPRALTTTPALTVLLLALWCWWPTAVSRTRVGLGWALMGFAVLVRPHFLPIVAICAPLALHRKRFEPATAVALSYIALFVFMIGFAFVVADTGGVEKTLGLMLSHARRAVAHEPIAGPNDLGFIRALGGIVPTVAWLGAGLTGLLFIQKKWSRLWGLLVFVTTLVVIVLLHPPHPRYAVLLLIAAAPGVALLAQRVIDIGRGRVWWSRAVIFVLLVLAGVSAGATLPAMMAMRGQAIPPVQALRALAREPGRRIVVTAPGMTPYARYTALAGQLEASVYTHRSLIRDHDPRPVPGGHTLSMLSLRHRGLPGATVRYERITGYPPAAWELSQRRYSEIHRVDNPILLGDGVSTPEVNSRGEPFAWLGKNAALTVPAPAETLVLLLDVDERRAPLQLRATIGRAPVHNQRLKHGTHRVAIGLDKCELFPCTVKLKFDRALAAEGKTRQLSARLYGTWSEGPLLTAYAQRWNPGQPLLTRARGVNLTQGFHGAEMFGDPKMPGSWLDDTATAKFYAVAGSLEVTLALPPPREGVVTLETTGHARTVAATGTPQTFTIPVDAPQGKDFLRITSHTLVPAERDPKNPDKRRLGAILFDVVLKPEG